MTIILKTAPKQPFLGTKTAIEHARRLKITQNLLQVTPIFSTVVLSYLDLRYEPECRQKEFSCVCCCLLIAVAAAAFACEIVLPVLGP